MQRFGQLIGVRAEDLEKYTEYHKEIWPEIARKITECNIQNYSIYHFQGQLFSYFEYIGNDFDGDMAKMAADKKTQEWWDIMKPMQQPVEGRADGEWWATMKEVFHQD